MQKLANAEYNIIPSDLKGLLNSCSRSQSKEDLFAVDHFFGSKKAGTFIELGALDGVTFSNTYLFEKCLNWNGILIEPSKRNFKQLMQNRPDQALLHAAICDSDSTVQFVENHAVGGILEYMAPSFIEAWHPHLLNKNLLLKNVTVDEQICTIWGPFENSFSESCAGNTAGPCQSFAELDLATASCFSNPDCAAITAVPGKDGYTYEPRSSPKLGKSESGEISYLQGPCFLQCIPLQTAIRTSIPKLHLSSSHFDFLSLDVEGAELEVLKTLRFEDTSFSVITIEANPNTPERNELVKSFLTARNYVYYGGDGFNNDWFHHPEFQPREPNKAAPPK